MVTAKHVPFLCVWENGYRDFHHAKQDYSVFLQYSVVTARVLADLFPDAIRVEEETMYRPTNNKEGLDQLFRGHYDWSNSYAVHIWHRHKHGDVPISPEEMDSQNSTVNQLMRRVYYDI